jgi:hypothetical protein
MYWDALVDDVGRVVVGEMGGRDAGNPSSFRIL